MSGLHVRLAGTASALLACLGLVVCNAFSNSLRGYEEFEFGMSVEQLTKKISFEPKEFGETGDWYKSLSPRLAFGREFDLRFNFLDDSLIGIFLSHGFEAKKEEAAEQCEAFFSGVVKDIDRLHGVTGSPENMSMEFKFPDNSGIYVRKHFLEMDEAASTCTVNITYYKGR